ncbi:hypothetical protein [Pseudomonas corrugata]|uniref:hypothetical protein n=1 Tax=Pseudomonas corrugata TaxID=47879 RepID=UPI000AF942ED|nr:hypothetical protein [Pseudomonas corrugata]
MKANEFSNDDISIFEIYNFFSRQTRTIIITFLLVLAIGLGYTASRPTLYKSTSTVTTGNSLSLYSDTLTPLERPEEIVYKYSRTATITPIKNTNIVEVSSVTEDPKQSIENINLTVKKITESQKTIYQTQEQNFVKYVELLRISDAANTRILDILQTASKSSNTYSSEILTEELPYSGKFKINLVLVSLSAVFVALFTGAVKELFRRVRESKY